MIPVSASFCFPDAPKDMRGRHALPDLPEDNYRVYSIVWMPLERTFETCHLLSGQTMCNQANHRLAKLGSPRGFSLVELLIVVIVILVIAAIAIPNLLRSRMLANESSAVSSIRQIDTAEGTYSSSWGTGYAPALASLGGPAPCLVATPAAACLIDPLLSTGASTRSGYLFNAAGTNPDANGVLNGYEVNATPVSLQLSGVRAFCSDVSGVIKFVTPGAAPIGVAAGACAGVPTVPGTSGPVGN